MNVTLKDGSVIEAAAGSTPADIAKSISEGLYRNALVAKVNGELVDLTRPIDGDCTLEILTYRDEEGKRAYRHTAAHILAQAIKNVYPAAQLAIGPATNVGFYYDVDLPFSVTMDELAAVENEMNEIIAADLPIERKVVTRKAAMSQMQGFNEVYKMQLIEELPKRSQITLYKQGNFLDLCRGPHLTSTGKVKHIKLTQLAGAYWKGDEHNKMLTRIYGVAFEKKSELDEYLHKLEEAKKRDHNKLGRDMGLFMTEERIGQGLPLFMPKGAKMMQTMQRFIEDEEERRGYMLTKTPYMAKSDLYKLSGHWDHYRDKMFIIGDEVMDDEVLALRPMTCPFQYMIYKNGLKSYRDLPCRYTETSTLFRKEASGEMHGLIRIRQFTLADAHIICTPEQLEDEFKNVLDLCTYVLDTLGFREDVTFRFSRWDPKDKDKYIYEPKMWKSAEDQMKRILDDLGVEYTEAEGEAAFYGPKLDIQTKNVYGKEDTLITLQVDMFLAEKFDMTYVDENGEKKTPYIIHRSSIGCYERTLAMLIEKYGGAFPLWLSPEQVRVLSLTGRTADKAKELELALKARGILATSDNRNEKIGYKIREAQMDKVPYMLILGDKEAESGNVSVRHRNDDLGQMSFDALVELLRNEIDTKAIK
ncbi:MAG: threonine--tRNA ligase [Clostridia bacterium]|nr:threonine--tRNA ligase [Clostridia bacterium]MCI9458965.1 threonine--tRNA ligase [Clostridia bacterium]